MCAKYSCWLKDNSLKLGKKFPPNSWSHTGDLQEVIQNNKALIQSLCLYLYHSSTFFWQCIFGEIRIHQRHSVSLLCRLLQL